MFGHYGQLSVPDAGMYNVGGLHLIRNSNLQIKHVTSAYRSPYAGLVYDITCSCDC